MSVCGQTEDGSSSEGGAGPGEGAETRAELHEQKAVSKVVRVLTVMAYLLSVSMAAILLSVYYVCVWRSPEPPPPPEPQRHVAPQHHQYHYHQLDYASPSHTYARYEGGSRTPVSEDGAVTPPLLINSTASSQTSDDPVASSEPPSELPTSLEPNTTDVTGPLPFTLLPLNDTKPT